MNAGILRERVRFERKTVTRDGFGGEVESWAAVATVWARVIPITGDEKFTQDGGRERAVQGYEIAIRHRSDLEVTMRAVWHSITLDLESIADPIGRKRHLLIKAKERST